MQTATAAVVVVVLCLALATTTTVATANAQPANTAMQEQKKQKENRRAGLASFVHVTDVHVDLRYDAGAPAHCEADDQLHGVGCCHKTNVARPPYRNCSEWGDYNCDGAPLMTNRTFLWMATGLPQPPQFIINTGDYASHHDVTQSPWENEGAMRYVVDATATAFPSVRQLNCFGNHDGWPVDNTIPGIYDTMLAKAAEHWSPYLSPAEVATVRKGGYYSTVLVPGLRLVVLNILWFDSNNVFFVKEQKDVNWDPRDSWAWLNDTLAAARAANEKVWLSSHFGPEAGESSLNLDVRLSRLLDAYTDIVLHGFAGHSHAHEFRLFYSYNGTRLIHSAVLPGAMYPSSHNPQFHVVYYDPQTFVVKDYDHYECDLNATILAGAVQCAKAYTFSEVYGEPDLTRESIARVVQKLRTNDTLMQFYHRHYAPGANPDNGDHPDQYCDASCAKGHIDSIVGNVAPQP